MAEVHSRPPGSALLDVREPDEWASGHAPGAVNVPMAELDAGKIPAGRPLYCICRSGNRSGRVVRLLATHGVDARNVTGGMEAWAAAGLPIVH